jgi:peptide chain release factor subunit 1
MITREELRQLAKVDCPGNSAVTFYFQPQTPQNKSHREEQIQVKDLVRDAMRRAEKNGNKASLRADLKRIQDLSEQLHGNHARGKAVFACMEKGIWREFNLPKQLKRTQLYVGDKFHLRPLAAVAASAPRCCVALVDRERGRLLELWMDEISERDEVVDPLPRVGRSDGFGGYDAGHNERHYENSAMRHFKNVAQRLRELNTANAYDAFIVGCREDVWPQLETHLHTYVRQKMLGRFTIDPAIATADQVREQARRILEERSASERQGLIREVLGGAQRNGRGKVGLRGVLEALERGEVQTLLFGEAFYAQGSECVNCRHLDSNIVDNCPACGQRINELQDITDAILRRALDTNIDVVYVGPDPEFEKAGKIGALLRFRADQATPGKLAGYS